MPLTPDLIEMRFIILKRARSDAFHKGELAIQLKAAYEEARVARIMDGTITGRNDTERDANARTVLADEYAAYQQAATNARLADHYLALGTLGVEEVKLLLRLLEASKTDEPRVVIAATAPTAPAPAPTACPF